MKLKAAALLVALTLATGCTVHKEWAATDGSKAHGTVTLVYEYSPLIIPETKAYQAESLAREKCEAWGYKGAKPFGAGEKTCTERSLTGLCETVRITMKMQCSGGFSYEY